MRRRPKDPVASLDWKQRRAWRRRDRAIVASYRADLAVALDTLIGEPVVAMSAGAAGTVLVTLPGWSLTLAGVGAVAQAALVRAAQHPCHLTDGGRYGRFWWLAFGVADDRGVTPVTVLGAALRLHPADGGDVSRTPGLTPHAIRKEYSRP
jgi:hypothetical protein